MAGRGQLIGGSIRRGGISISKHIISLWEDQQIIRNFNKCKKILNVKNIIFFKLSLEFFTMTLFVSKIKNLLQTNQLIGKIDSPVSLIISFTLEIFMVDILNHLLSLLRKIGKKKIRTKYIKYIIKKKRRFKNFIQ